MQNEGINIRLIYFKKILFVIVVIFFSLMHSCCQIEESYYFEDDEGVGWINCGEGPSWHLDTDQYYNGTQSMKSGDIECNGVSTLCRKIQGPASIEFWWKSIPIPNEGSQLSFYIDEKKERSWNSEWRKEPPISLRDNKSYIAKWELVKKDCPPGTKGFAWIDDIKIKYHDSPSLCPIYPPVPVTNKTVYVSQKSQSPQPFVYKSINEAIKHVVPGGIVRIDEGLYKEQIIISFPLLLIGKGKEKTKIYYPYGTVIKAKSDDITIKNLAIEGDSLENKTRGIRISGINCLIENNSIYNFYEGIVAEDCQNISIQKNELYTLNRVGIYLINTTDSCEITFNEISQVQHGICLYNARESNLDNNDISYSENGISLRNDSQANVIGSNNKFSFIKKCDISNDTNLINEIPSGCNGDKCIKCD